MGRKKRKVQHDPAVVVGDPVVEAKQDDEKSKSQDVLPATVELRESNSKPSVSSSGYAMTSHSGDFVGEEVYVSDGSVEDENTGAEVEVVLTGSRMGVMRRGVHPSLLQQQNRQWVRSENTESSAQDGEEGQPTAEELEEQRRQQEEEELAKLDPAQRAARLLAEKQRKLEEAKESARRLESEENAGRDPCLFSKRTAFDIRMDQIEDKPWVRGNGDVRDFFNYGLTEEDWLEYSQSQLQIRQELTDASRQRRLPDPAIVPVAPRAPQKQNPKVAVASTTAAEEGGELTHGEQAKEDLPMIGPALGAQDDKTKASKSDEEKSRAAAPGSTTSSDVKHLGTGGAWGAGVAPDSVLARLIEEQGRSHGTAAVPPPPPPQKPSSNLYPSASAGPGETPEGGDLNADGNDDVSRSDPRSHQDPGNGQEEQQWGDGQRSDWRHRNEYDRGRYDSSRNYPPSQFRPRRGGYGPPSYSRGRGGYGQRSYAPHMGRGGLGGRGNNYDYHSRKRPRDDYDGSNWNE